MIVRVQYRLPGKRGVPDEGSATVVSCVEMSAEQLQAYRTRIEAGEPAEQVRMEAEAACPRAHRKHWQYASEEL